MSSAVCVILEDRNRTIDLLGGDLQGDLVSLCGAARTGRADRHSRGREQRHDALTLGVDLHTDLVIDRRIERAAKTGMPEPFGLCRNRVEQGGGDRLVDKSAPVEAVMFR